MDLERVFPRSPEVDYTERLAHAIHQIVISKAKYLIYLHGGGDSEIIDFAVFAYFNAKTKDANREMAFACDYDYAFGMPERILGGGLQAFHASAAGIPSIGLESNDREIHPRNIMRILVHLGVLEGKAIRKEKIRIKSLHVLRCKHSGVFIPIADCYHKVSKGQVIGRVVDLIGETIEEINSQTDGMVMTVRRDPIVKSTWNTRLVGLT